jgi:hypothetical protein
MPDVTNKSNKNPFPDWDLEEGYNKMNPLHFDKKSHLKEKPYRSDIAGLDGGLTFTLDLQANNIIFRPPMALLKTTLTMIH